MSKRLTIASILIIGVMAGSATAQSLVEIDPASVETGNVYLFENVTATTVPDDSANGHTLDIVGAPQLVTGLTGQALLLDGVDDAVHVLDAATINTSTHQNRTVIAVFNCADVSKSTKQTIYDEGGDTRGLSIYVHEGLLYVGGWNKSDYTPQWNPGTWISTPIGSNEWHAVALVLRNGGAGQADDRFEMWLDGKLIGRGPGGELRSRTNDGGIGYSNSQVVFHDGNGGAGNYFEGMIDEVWILSDALTQEQLAGVTVTPGKARLPVPNEGAVDVLRKAVVSWNAGKYAQMHDVYLGTALEDVDNATRTDPRGVLISQDQTETVCDPPGLLDFDQTYYWRVDEVNGAPDYAIYKGEIWSFTVEPYAIAVEGVLATSNMTALVGQSLDNIVNETGLTENDEHSTETTDMWAAEPNATEASYIQFEFPRVYKMHEMLVWNYNMAFESVLGFGAKDTTVEYSEDGIAWNVLDDVELAQATSSDDYLYNTTVDFQGVPAKYVRLTIENSWSPAATTRGLSEVRFMYVPAHAREPQPADGSADLSANTVLSWRGGHEALSHEIYTGTDPNALALLATTEDTTYTESFDLDTTYYWKVVEVTADGTWESDVWSFSTQPYIVLEDFEAYDDNVEAGTTIWQTWIDGLDDSTHGGGVAGNTIAPFAEQTIVHHPGQSLNFFYTNDNASSISEADRTLEPAQNWAGNAIESLSLWFHGAAGNTGQMYIKIDGTQLLYDGPASDIATPQWQPWNIDLSTAGVDLSNVTVLTVGVQGAGSGVVYFDDMRLYPQGVQKVTPVEPDAAGLVSHFAFDGNADDSTGAHDGTIVGSPAFVAGKDGQAIQLNGVNDYVQLAGYKGILGANPITVAAWVRTESTDTGAIVGWGPNVAGQRFGFRINADRLRHEHHGGNIQGASIMNDGAWHHVAITVEPNATVSHPQAILYLDGVDDTRDTTDPDAYAIVAGEDACIGCRPAAYDRLFTGEIDELYIYERTLSQAEIAWLAGRTTPLYKRF